jgi:hypothetical protein
MLHRDRIGWQEAGDYPVHAIFTSTQTDNEVICTTPTQVADSSVRNSHEIAHKAIQSGRYTSCLYSIFCLLLFLLLKTP